MSLWYRLTGLSAPAVLTAVCTCAALVEDSSVALDVSLKRLSNRKSWMNPRYGQGVDLRNPNRAGLLRKHQLLGTCRMYYIPGLYIKLP